MIGKTESETEQKARTFLKPTGEVKPKKIQLYYMY